jgi:hypothetical protein
MNTGQIVKSRTTERFTTLPNDLIKSKVLTLDEKGLLSYLLSLPADWVLYKQNLYTSLPDKKGSIDRAFKNLQKKNYIQSVKVNDKQTGRFIGWNHVVYDLPTRQSENPTIGKPDFGESAPILNTNLILNTNKVQKDFIKPTLEEVVTFFVSKGDNEQNAKTAFEYYDIADWHDSFGKKIKNWKQKMLSVWINKNNFKQKQNGKLDAYKQLNDEVAANLKQIYGS